MRKIAVLTITLFALCGAARAQYPGAIPGTHMATMPDVVLTAGAAPVQILPANPMRVSIWCTDVSGSNPSRVGDSTTSANQGTLLAPGGPPLVLPVRGPLYAYSALGSVINCSAIVRNGSTGP